ncbi:Box C/D snoRNA accumulation [Microbotryomycetes sp. JL201]|nr:Box C/D snoRNA accumulation [Microbotryomycetes sp. JL201]
MRDQSFISSVSRKTESIGRDLVGDKLIPQGRTLAPSRLDERNEKEDKLVKEARKQDVDLVLLPKGMSRRTRNNSRWNPKQKALEWTTELILHPMPGSNSSKPETLVTGPHASTTTLFAIVSAALGSRDKKGKAKAVSEGEMEFRTAQWRWLSTFKPEETGKKEDTADETRSDASATEEDESEPAFLLLLSLYTPPPRSSRPDQDAENETADTDQREAPVLPNKRPARKFSIATPSSTLQSMLTGATVLEFPTFELWTTEGFTAAKAAGEIDVVERLSSLPERQSRSDGVWNTGRGRGRGRGGLGSRGGGRGTFSSARSRYPSDGANVSFGRTSDEGWQKRKAAVELGKDAESESSTTVKHARVESERPKVDDDHADAVSAGPGLVAYDSD